MQYLILSLKVCESPGIFFNDSCGRPESGLHCDIFSWQRPLLVSYPNVIYLLGLIPIIIGEKVVDLKSGEMSPVVGVDWDKKYKTVVPVTISSSNICRHKPSPGVQNALEEEIARNGKVDEELADIQTKLLHLEFQLSQSAMYQQESVTPLWLGLECGGLEKKISFLEGIVQKDKEEYLEVLEDFVIMLPVDVLGLFTEHDDKVEVGMQGLLKAHCHLVGVLEMYEARLGRWFAEDPTPKDGEKSEKSEEKENKRADALVKIHCRMSDEVIRSLERINKADALLNSARLEAKLWKDFARSLLCDSAVYMKDFYKGIVRMVGGEDRQELIPLMRKVIELLEYDSLFEVSITKETEQLDWSVKNSEAAVKNLLRGDNSDPSWFLLHPDQLGKEKKIMKDKKAIAQALAEKQVFEAVRAENELQKHETKLVNRYFHNYEHQKSSLIQDGVNTLEVMDQKLGGLTSDEEKVKAYKEVLDKLWNDLVDFQSRQQGALEKLHKLMINSRRKEKKALRNLHVAQAKQLKLPVESAVAMPIPLYADLDKKISNLLYQLLEWKLLSSDLPLSLKEEEAELVSLLKQHGCEEQRKADDVKIISDRYARLSDSLRGMLQRKMEDTWTIRPEERPENPVPCDEQDGSPNVSDGEDENGTSIATKEKDPVDGGASEKTPGVPDMADIKKTCENYLQGVSSLPPPYKPVIRLGTVYEGEELCLDSSSELSEIKELTITTDETLETGDEFIDLEKVKRLMLQNDAVAVENILMQSVRKLYRVYFVHWCNCCACTLVVYSS
jgi:hypothetical protein